MVLQHAGLWCLLRVTAQEELKVHSSFVGCVTFRSVPASHTFVQWEILPFQGRFCLYLRTWLASFLQLTDSYRLLGLVVVVVLVY